MNDNSHITEQSDSALILRIGNYIKTTRINLNLTQDEVAERAAISRSTLSLLERGENIALLNLIKVMRVLDVLYVLDNFEVSTPISPIKLAKADAKRRKRASGTTNNDKTDDLGW